MRNHLQSFQARGKPIVAYFTDQPTDADYYVAAVADWIVCPPVSLVDVNGLVSEATFYTRLMDKIGVGFDYQRVGKYKSAVEPYSRTEMSDPAREARQAVLDDIYEELVVGIADGRGLSRDSVKQIIEGGPYASIEAQDAGLVDQIAYEDELDDIISEHISENAGRVGVRSLAERQYRRYRWGPQPEIVVITGEGSIMDGYNRTSPIFGQVLGAQTMVQALRAATDDPAIKAIVLRLNSPGGSSIASDKIWRAVTQAREQKPVVVSMSDVAASGGYYIAAPADTILASPTTVTGSIGVFYGKVHLEKLYDKIGIDKEVLLHGSHADMYSLYQPFSEEERAILGEQVNMMYDRFVDIVAEGRDQTPGQVDEIAQGRVWTGKAARENGLIDSYGGLPEAIGAAIAMANVDPEDVKISVYPKAETTWLPHFTIPSLPGILGLVSDPDVAELTTPRMWYLLPWQWIIE